MSDTQNAQSGPVTYGPADAVVRVLTEAAPDLQGTAGWRDTVAVGDTIRDSTANLKRAAARIMDDPDLVPAAKAQRVNELTTAWEAQMREHREALQRHADDLEARLRPDATPRPPEGTTDGQLQLARSDLLMVLDRTPDEKLGQRMESLARNGDATQRALLLGSWGNLYLQARGSNPASVIWARARDELLPEALPEKGRRALAGLRATQNVRTAGLFAEQTQRHVSQDVRALTRGRRQ